MRAFLRLIGFLWSVCAIAFADGETKEYHLKLSLDPLLELNTTWSLGAAEINARFQDPDFKKNPFVQWTEGDPVALFSSQPFQNVSVDLSMLDGGVALAGARITFDPSDHKVSRILLTAPNISAESLAKLRGKAASLIGGVAKQGPRLALGWKADAEAQSEMWSGLAGTAILQTSKMGASLSLGRPGVKPAELIADSGMNMSPDRLEFFVRLDELLPVPGLWGVTPDEFDARVSMRNVGLKENPLFKWNTKARDSARFSKDLFANTKTDVWLFNDSLRAEEVNVEFTNGRASKLVITLLSRGNSGSDLSPARFTEVSGAAARSLGAMMGVRPTHTAPAGMMLVKTDGYLWTTPHSLALLEYNADAPKGKVEFLRLTMTPAAARKQLMNTSGLGNFATTRTLISLMGSVKRDRTTGDVEITGVPMRDQGQKGYCVAAACERLLKYLGQPCDMDELAQLVAADAQLGASPSVMYRSLSKIDQQYNLRLTLELIARQHRLEMPVKNRAELEHAQKAELDKVIQESIDHGVPLLWGVELPREESGVSPQPGVPDVPVMPGVTRPMTMRNVQVGHMRMIIGYNAKTHAVIYTDSWGAGHERKVMPLQNAEKMTDAVFSMTPIR